MKKLDHIDKRILGILRQNSREAYSKIAKEIKINRSIVPYRIEQLIKKGVIRSFEPRIDYKKLGYQKFLCYIGFYEFDKEHKEKIINYLKNHPFCAWLGECIGKFQIRARFLAKDRHGFYRILSGIKKEFGTNIRELKAFDMIDSIKPDNEVLFKGKKGPIEKKNRTTLLDEKDLILLQNLAKNCRETLLNLSRRTDLSIEGLRNRLKILEKSGIITGFTCNIDTHRAEDIQLWGNFLVDFKHPEKIEKKLKEFTSKHKQLGRSFLLFGDWNAEFTFFAKDVKELQHVLTEFLTTFSRDMNSYDIVYYLDG
ncbi:winged helix-turn-helix transcriptional regulator, partial [Candidatus Woesearchaeota archaeon]|nr:winged helix-turn-helix transcriptional regulator [Candidatus Woesearchaeota archaeon]